MSVCTLNGRTVLTGRVNIPAWGCWHASVEIDRAEQLTGAVTLVVADLTLKGTILSGGPWQSRARYRVVGGAGGWGKSIKAASETNDLGVKIATVVQKAADAVGEKLGPIPAGTVGPSFVRAEGLASRVLDAVAEKAWYVDELGVTRFGARAAKAYAGNATRLDRDLAQGRIELAASSIADLLPGVTVDGIEAADVEHVVGENLRTTLWGKSKSRTGNPAADELLRIIETATAHTKFFAPYEYRVVLRTGERLELQPVRVSAGMPNLSNVRVRSGVAGCRSYPALGSLVLVSFVNGDQSRPVVTSYEEPESPGFIPTAISLEAGSTGTEATEHATSAQALVLFVQTVLEQLATPFGGTAAVDAAVLAAIPLAAAATLSGAAKTAIGLALDGKTPNTAGTKPSLGWPSVRGG